jgi:hypothetical protein
VVNFKWIRLPNSPKARIFLAVFGILIAVFFIIFVTAPLPAGNRSASSGLSDEFKRQFAEELNKDFDNDGLKNWEEAVYGTDPRSADTDGDKTADGEEIRTNRNPLAKGPGDSVLPSEENPATFVYDESNLTHLFTQKVAADGTFQKSLSGEGENISAAAVTEYAKSLPYGRAVKEPVAVKESSLRISDDTSGSAVNNYFNAFAAIYMHYGDSLVDDILVAQNLLVNPTITDMQKLKAMETALEKIVTEANTLSIPKNILWFHKQEVYFLEKSKNEITVLKEIQKDPLSALLALDSRIDTKERLTTLHAELEAWFSKNAISASTNARLFFFN